MITCFRKGNKESLTKAEKQSINSLVEQIKENLRKQRSSNERN